ncbi:histidinol-phosphate transaminase [Halorubellus sp. JP-L1]|uniref:histidinol-phosphate transaminase n=1 Tax=Halorubellus sp. JP-L1 TaxID=2715753 RepID=UPI00140D94DD|nr:histidinol-phosphate transaminase [Halorubellus sp. JP-L1]NHN40361.1 histidinol-phosphate transaminase [Halorubellus sp. JP-L1]
MQPRDLSAHVPYEAGRGIEEVARDLGMEPGDLVKLASNENPFGPPDDAVSAIKRAAEHAASYPKAAHTDLTDAIADRHGVEPAQIWLANGGDGALDYLARAALDPGDDVLVPDPGFAYYGMSARFHHGDVESYELSRPEFAQDADVVCDQYDGERVVYLTSPHNPTGGVFELGDVVEIADRTDEETLVVVDEAYVEYADTQSGVSLLGGDGATEHAFAERDDVAVLRTFSKAFGLAGVRLGYAVVPRGWADAYARVNTPFAASELACRAGLAALDADEHVEQSVETARWSRQYMRDALDAPVWESQGNFVLVDVADARGPESASAVASELQERGVIVRDCTSFGLPGCIRVTCGTESETERAVDAINEVLAE